MNPPIGHIIQKQIIEINFQNHGRTLGLENEVADVFYEKLQPRLEVLLDEIFGNNYKASIDKLEIDCGILNKKNWKQEFTEQAIRQLKTKLIEVNKKEIKPIIIEKNAAEAFFYYLENGYMPWNNRFDTLNGLEQQLNVNETLIERLKLLIAKKEKAIERLAFHFSERIISPVISGLIKDTEVEPDEITSFLKKYNLLPYSSQPASQTGLKLIDKKEVFSAFLKLCTSNTDHNTADRFFSLLLTKVIGNEELKEDIRQLRHTFGLKERNLKSSERKDAPKRQKISEKVIAEIPEAEQEAIYINNAGLVLLHPFLQSLFENLGLTQNNRWIDSASTHLAILVTEHLVTGQVYPEEFNLVLNKILCGVDPGETVVTDVMLQDEMKDECGLLLNEVITQWSVLKNTSVDGLRETFLQRNGKLTRMDNGWLLQVEQKSVDILLNHLPWGIGIIKLPWMTGMLFVEWT